MKTRMHLHTYPGDDLEAVVNTAAVKHGHRIWWLDLGQGTVTIHTRNIDALEQLANDILAQCTLWRGVPGVISPEVTE